MAGNEAIATVRDSEGIMSEPKILKYRNQAEIKHRITVIQFLMIGVMGAFIFAIIMLFHIARKQDMKYNLQEQALEMRFG